MIYLPSDTTWPCLNRQSVKGAWVWWKYLGFNILIHYQAGEEDVLLYVTNSFTWLLFSHLTKRDFSPIWPCPIVLTTNEGIENLTFQNYDHAWTCRKTSVRLSIEITWVRVRVKVLRKHHEFKTLKYHKAGEKNALLHVANSFVW